MLQYIREKAQGFIAWSIVILISVIFSLWGLADYFSGSKQNHVAATVNGSKIYWYDVDRIYQDVIREYSYNNNNIDDINPKEIKNNIRDSLAKELAILSMAKSMGFSVEKEHVEGIIRSFKEFQKDGNFQEDLYSRYLSSIELSDSSFKENIKNKILLSLMRDGVITSSFSLDKEQERFIYLLEQERSFGYSIIPSSKFHQDIKISEDEIKKYYLTHKSQFKSEEQIAIDYITLSLDKEAENVDFTEDDLINYYNDNIETYTTPEVRELKHILIEAEENSDQNLSGEARAQIDDLLAKIKLGENFDDLAKKYSMDNVSAKDGGYLGWFSLGQLEVELEKAAFTLKNKGEISDIIQTQYGYHIIKLLNKKDSSVKEYADVKSNVEQLYKKSKAEETFLSKAEELAIVSFENPDSIQRVADLIQLPLESTEEFSKNNQPDKLPSRVINEAFSEELINGDVNSDLVKIDDEKYIVFRVSKHIEAKELELELAKESIVSILLNTFSLEQAKEFAKNFINKLNEGVPPFQLAKDNNLTWQVADNIKRTNIELDQQILAKAFSLQKPQSTIVSDLLVLNSSDVAIVSLKNVSFNLDSKNNQDYLSKYKNQLDLALLNSEYSLFEEMLINKSDISFK